MCRRLFLLLFLCVSLSVSSQSLESKNWVDSIMSNMTEEERISQLFMVAAYSNKGNSHVSYISNLIKNYKVGGLMFLQGGPVRQAKLTN